MSPIELRYSEDTVRSAVTQFYKRTVGVSLPIVLALMLVFFIYLLATSNTGRVTGLAGSAVAFGLAFLIALYVAHYRNSMQRFRAMKDPKAVLELHDDSLTIRADSGSNVIPSASITEVWTYEDFWLVFLSRAEFFTIPMSDLGPDTREAIRSRFDSWGLKFR